MTVLVAVAVGPLALIPLALARLASAAAASPPAPSLAKARPSASAFR